ncbi:MAG: alanine racemase [Dermatophilaceae bacterium]
MSLTLHVDTARWREHLVSTTSAVPGLVPVAKGNGYGFGAALLLAECTRLREAGGLDMVAVGTYLEAPAFLAHFPGDVLVLEPYRPSIHRDLPHLGARPLVHTVTSPEDLRDLVTRVPAARVVLEGLTSMNRHGMPPPSLAALLAEPYGADVVGATLHLPLGSGHVEEVRRWVTHAPQARTWLLSHVSPAELAALRAAHPRHRFRPRIGTALWLGVESALSVRAHVLDVRRVVAGDRAGYRQRRLRDGHLLVVSGGTAHGVALEAPSPAATLRQRAIALAEGVLEASGRVRSPFTVGGHGAWFVEPPHMQVSLLQLPAALAPPEVGDTVPVRVRHTTLHADAVVLS